ncbi:hypothetical protein N9L68_04155 [bacterium]|nr:hypothetical protein [bacterium]
MALTNGMMPLQTSMLGSVSEWLAEQKFALTADETSNDVYRARVILNNFRCAKYNRMRVPEMYAPLRAVLELVCVQPKAFARTVSTDHADVQVLEDVDGDCIERDVSNVTVPSTERGNSGHDRIATPSLRSFDEVLDNC